MTAKRVPSALHAAAYAAPARSPLEQRCISISIVPLADAATIVVARRRGLFERHGLDVTVSVEPSWASTRDKLVAGAVDAAHLLAPMAIAATLGAGPLRSAMVTALSLGMNGNAITVSRELAAQLPEKTGAAALGAALRERIAARARSGERRLRLASVFPYSMHSYLLRHWLAASGIDPDADVDLRVVPPPRMVERLDAGAIDAFCVGEPWNTLAVQRGGGRILLSGREIWGLAPEKVLGVKLAWAERHPETHLAMLAALIESAAFCDAPENREEVERALSETLGLSLEALLPSLAAAESPGAHVFSRYAASFPWRSHAAWIVAQMLRWGQIERPVDVKETAERVYRTDWYREAALRVGHAAPREDWKIEGAHAAAWSVPSEGGALAMAPDRFFDGREFDPAQPLAGPASAPSALDADELASARREL